MEEKLETLPLETWKSQADSLKYIDKMVTVFDAATGKELLKGKVVGYTDLLNSGGIQPDPERGFDNVKAAFRFPQDPKEFTEQMSKYRFRVEK